MDRRDSIMDVSIIIVNYNTVNLLIDAIDSVLEKSNDFTYEIIVVDNNSSDNSQQILSERYGDKVRYIALPENIGFGRANNRAAFHWAGHHRYDERY